MRQRIILGAGAVVVVVVAVLLLTNRGDKKKTVTTAGSTTVPASTPTTSATSTTASAAAGGSAAGKPCVPLADPLPAGAPTVSVVVGPPPSQLVTKDLKVGDGPAVSPGMTVTVDYIGVACSTGKIFDSSYSRNQPATFPLGQVIQGWQEGIPGMRVGSQRLLGIPAALAYGAQGRPPTIAPDEALWFVVDVKDTKA